MNSIRIPKIDPHVDIADLYKEFKLSMNDFYSKKEVPVSLEELKRNNIKIVGATLYYDSSFVKTSYYDGVHEFLDWYNKLLYSQSEIYLFKKFSEIDESKIGFFHSIEGFECFRNPEDFDHFYDLGVRAFGFTWSHENKYACGRSSIQDTGISKLGLDVIDKMNNKPLIVDIAHLSERSVEDLGKNFNGMIVSTHGNLRSIWNTSHNLKDSEIDLIVERGGVVSLFPLAEDTGQQGSLDEFYKHVEYVINKWGIDYLAIASDIYPLEEYPFLENHKSISVLNAIEDYFKKHMHENDIKKIFHDNWIRVLKCLK